ncbi:hypothetical protein ACF0H5_019738 [Mactra antiquata]
MAIIKEVVVVALLCALITMTDYVEAQGSSSSGSSTSNTVVTNPWMEYFRQYQQILMARWNSPFFAWGWGDDGFGDD